MTGFRSVLSHDSGYAWQVLDLDGGRLRYKGNEWEIGTALRRWHGAGSRDADSLLRLLAALPCTFAVVLECDGQICAAVDHLRGHPLFYSRTPGGVDIIDDPYAGDGNQSLRADDRLPIAEFQLAGYVTGRDTLSTGLKALQSGEFLRVFGNTEAPIIEVGRYRPTIHEPALPAGADLNALLMQTCDEIFAELCAGIRDRQIVLPLSSGVDSRFIAAMLKRHGHERILTFTYGRPENWEVDGSRRVAQHLGMDWRFVEYDRQRWRAWFQSPEMARYARYSSRHVATPHVQDWPAIMELHRQGLLQPDAVFIPGHTGILISNRLEARILALPGTERLDQLTDQLLMHHFMLQRMRRVIANPAEVKDRVRALLPDAAATDPHRLLNAYYNFEATERHSKMLINSVRGYEFWGYQWALPLWDGRLVKLWARVPWEGRYAKRAFREFLHGSNLYGIFPRPPAPGIYERLRAKAKDNPLTFPALRRLKYGEERLFGYFHHFLDWYGIVSYPEYVYHMGQFGNVYSILSRLYLASLNDADRARASEHNDLS
jgi:asparagine synthase (glutamine-hydrolysing)